jgi:hypothetical protein
MSRTKFRILLCHFSEYRLTGRVCEAYRNFPDVQIEHDFTGFGFAQYERRSQRRMTRKGELFLHREDAYSHPALAFHGRITRQNESCLGEIHLPRHRLHLFVAQPSGVWENRQGIALQGN